MVKVLHFVSTLSIGSGVMSVIMNYYRHMDRSKVQFDFLCFIPCEDSYEEEIVKLGGHIFFVSKPRISTKSLCEMRDFFSKYGKNYSFLHNHEVYLSFLLKPLAKKYHIPHFIIHCHATKFSDRRLAAIRNAVLCAPIRFFNCTKFACSVAAGEFLFGTDEMKEKRVHVLNNGIELKRFFYNQQIREERRREYDLTDRFVIGHVGRFNNQKNHRFLVDTFALVSKVIPNACLLLIGEGPLKSMVENRCCELNIENKVLFLGQRSDIRELYSVMDLFVLPSIYEGVGIVLLEAQANGLCCLASDKVPAEAQLTNGIRFLSLDKMKWLTEIQQIYESGIFHERLGTDEIQEAFQRKHYDIETESYWLQKYYENTDTDVYI